MFSEMAARSDRSAPDGIAMSSAKTRACTIFRQAFFKELGDGKDPNESAARVLTQICCKAPQREASDEGKCVQGVQSLCSMCRKTIRGAWILQDGCILHFGCTDLSRSWKELREEAQKRYYLNRRLLPARTWHAPRHRAGDRARPARCLALPSFSSNGNSVANASPFNLQCVYDEHVAVTATLVSGAQHGLTIPSSRLVHISDLRRHVAEAMGFIQTEVMLAHGTQILQGNWRIDKVFGGLQSIEVSAVMTRGAKIPLEDVMDPALPEVEYVADIHAEMKAQEIASNINVQRQLSINMKMRAILLDWLVEVHQKYKLRTETFFMAVKLVDRYWQLEQIARPKLQLVGVVSMHIAAKWQDVSCPTLSDWVYVTDKTYTRDEIAAAECQILSAFHFNLSDTTAWHFVEIYSQIQQQHEMDKEQHRHVVQYLLELFLVLGAHVFEASGPQQGAMAERSSPSELAAAAIVLANRLLKRTPEWSAEQAMYAGYTAESLKACVQDLHDVLRFSTTSPCQAVQKKFARQAYGSVAKLLL